MSHSKEDDLKLGSITEVWTSREQWLKYCQYLDNMAAEAYDSEGVPIKLSRYALFLKLYVDLFQIEKYLREQGKDTNTSNEELKTMVLNIKQHPEDFFGLERSLSCIDAGVRKEVLTNLKKVRKNESPAGSWVYRTVYSRVLDKLNHMLGGYHQWMQTQNLPIAAT